MNHLRMIPAGTRPALIAQPIDALALLSTTLTHSVPTVLMVSWVTKIDRARLLHHHGQRQTMGRRGGGGGKGKEGERE